MGVPLLNGITHFVVGFVQLDSQAAILALGSWFLVQGEFERLRLRKTARNDSWSVPTYCTRNGSCVDSDIGIGSWSMNTYCTYTRTDNCV